MSSDPEHGDQSWWLPRRFQARRGRLEARARLLRTVREWFHAQGFTEVETPALQVSPGMEAHTRTFSTVLYEPFGQGGRTLHLHTSPEFAMKKLLAAGMERIYQTARVYRNAERSPLHHPEFTMLEWYRAGVGLDAMMADMENLVWACARALGVRKVGEGAATCDLTPPWPRLTLARAFREMADIDLLATVDDPHDPDPDPAALARAAARIGVRTGEKDRWEDVALRILLERIEPNLGMERPVFLHDYPACMAALARRKPSDPRVAERCELYIRGIEIANAFAELTDAAEQRRRFAHARALKHSLYGEDLPIDEDFLAALDHGLPESSGTALGFDRLVMTLTGADRIEQVLWGVV